MKILEIKRSDEPTMENLQKNSFTITIECPECV